MTTVGRSLEPNESITLLTVGYYSWDYTRLASFTADRLAGSGWKEWLIMDNTPGEAEAELLATLPRARVLPKKLARPCMDAAPRYPHGHAQDYACAVNTLYQSVKTEYALLVDPDVAFLREGWDRILVEEMESGGYDAIGGPYNPRKWQKYAGYPSVIFLLIRTKLLQESNFDFCSYSRNPLSRRFENFLHRYQGRISRFFPEIIKGSSQDVGWRLPHLFKSHHSKTLTFDVPTIRPIDNYYAGPLRRIKPKGVFQRPSDGLFHEECLVSSEYDEFWHRGSLFATHHGGSTGAGWASEKTQIWYSRIKNYLGFDDAEFARYLADQSVNNPSFEDGDPDS